MSQYAGGALAKGLITEEDIDTALYRAFRVLLRSGHFNDESHSSPLDYVTPDTVVCSGDALALGAESARQGAVLLKNSFNSGDSPFHSETTPLLPLTEGSYPASLIVGPVLDLVDTWKYYGGPGCNPSKPFSPSEATLFSTLSTHFSAPDGTTTLASLKGVPSVASNDVSGVPAAAAMAASVAKQGGVVFLALGSDLAIEGEGLDRFTVSLSQGQLELASAVAASAAAAAAAATAGTAPVLPPVIAILMGGGLIDCSPLLNNPNISSVAWFGVPSVQVGGSVASLFTETRGGIAGRLPGTMLSNDAMASLTFTDFSMRPNASSGYPGRTYRFYQGEGLVLPFGFGLSYSTWVYTPVSFPPSLDLTSVEVASKEEALTGRIGNIHQALSNDAVVFTVNVSNTGTRDSDEVVLGFLTPPGAGLNGVPLQELFGFERVFVRAGETVTVYLGAQGVRFTQADKEGVRHVLRGEYKVTFGVKETASGGGGFAESSLTCI